MNVWDQAHSHRASKLKTVGLLTTSVALSEYSKPAAARLQYASQIFESLTCLRGDLVGFET